MDDGGMITEIYIRRIEGRIKDIYEEAEKNLDKKLNDFVEKYKVKEAKYAQQVKDGIISQKDFDNWKKGQVFQGEQWKAKKKQVTDVLTNANKLATKISNEYRGNVFVENSNYQAYLLEHKAGVNFGFGLYDSSAVVEIVKANREAQILPRWKIDEPKDYIWNNRNVNNAVVQGIIQGERLDQIATRMAEGLSAKNKNKMLTFARTGMTQAQNAGRVQRLGEAEGMGIKVHKEWMATLDERTRTTHQILDGQRVPINEPFEAGGYSIMYPGDPHAAPAMVYNCRCTLVGDLDDYPSEYERYDNINGKPIKGMTYAEWKAEKNGVILPQFTQAGIGAAKTVKEVNGILNSAGVFTTTADLTGCDLDSAKSIAAAYEQVFAKYPQLKGRLDAPDAHPVNMSDDTYAWCYIRNGGKVQVNPTHYNDWSKVQKMYEKDILSGWHPKGTTAESVVTHEVGHAIDGLLAREGVLGGVTSSGEYRYASSSMRSKIMKRAAKLDPDLQDLLNYSWDPKYGMERAVRRYVSGYATKNPQEWFAECFAEYITSANPRVVATEFGKELERLVKKIQ